MDWVADDLVLLSLRPNGKFLLPHKLPFAVAGADMVAVMALLGRAYITDDRIIVTDARPTGDQLLDVVLASMMSDKRPLKARKWVSLTGGGLIDNHLAQLAAAGVVQEQRRGRWHIIAPARYDQARARLDAVAFGTASVDLPLAALAGLTEAIGLARLYYRKNERRRLRAAGESHPAVAEPVYLARRAAAAADAAAANAAATPYIAPPVT